ncbi:DUF4352 domain-containing protein [Microlunatus elymi]|uniref:DUF4352 domain-containing protein n=1 Tax=Microlunatus elymi TaxID=2596828 RepID=A0A516PY41_9ACTN|nr:DUF4352 domain-containing protein [Microlunatus elymi]QDP96093.1 DUF4352 domain-containing protein [Microlunatus elymi]
MSSEPTGLGPQQHGPGFERPDAGRPPGPQWGAPGPQWGAPGQRPPELGGTGHGGGPTGPWQPTGDRPSQPPRPQPERPPKNRLPAILTAAVIALVALIVVIATVRANVADRENATAGGNTPTPTPSAVPKDTKDSITFSSTEGSGRLTVRSHRWTSSATGDPIYGHYLQLEVEISATEGRISYGPQYFQTFDKSSNVYQTSEAGARPPLLATGYLRPGQTVRGGIAFDMPRGPVTLLMSNSLLESVTAIRIAD